MRLFTPLLLMTAVRPTKNDAILAWCLCVIAYQFSHPCIASRYRVGARPHGAVVYLRIICTAFLSTSLSPSSTSRPSYVWLRPAAVCWLTAFPWATSLVASMVCFRAHFFLLILHFPPTSMAPTEEATYVQVYFSLPGVRLCQLMAQYDIVLDGRAYRSGQLDPLFLDTTGGFGTASHLNGIGPSSPFWALHSVNYQMGGMGAARSSYT